jgi:outer membrane lipoprotein SlyB
MKFKDYLNEQKSSVSSISDIISKRKKIMKSLEKQKKYIDKSFMKQYNKAITLIDPKLLEQIDTSLTEGKNPIMKDVQGLVKIADAVLTLPYYGSENEKLIKQDFYNLAESISILTFTKFNTSTTKSMLKESEKSDKFWQIAGNVLGGAAGGALAGPAGVIVGILLGGVGGHEVNKYLETKADELKYSKYNPKNWDWENIILNTGILMGSVAGILVGSGFISLIAGGLVGGVVASYVMDTVGSLNESEIQEKVLDEKFDLKSLKSLASKTMKKLESYLFNNQRKLQRKIEALYKQRKQSLKF